MKMGSWIVVLPISLITAFSPVVPSAAPARTAEVTTLPPAKKEIVKLTETGIRPQTIRLAQRDSSVFFLNATESALVTLSVDYGKHRAHCASPNLKLGDDGVMRSTNPIGPKDFAISCFPDTGSYRVVVKGIGAKELHGQIIVE